MTNKPDPLGPRPFGLTPRQKKYAELRHAGLEKREAYFEAGYTGTVETSIRSGISLKESHERIQQYRMWLLKHDHGDEDGPPGADAALERLWREGTTARSDSARVKALIEYGKIAALGWSGASETPADRMAKTSSEQLLALISNTLGERVAQAAANQLGVELKRKAKVRVPDGETIQ